MKLISFGWTTPALLAGEKTCTRRDWTPGHAARFKAGELVAAWNALPRVVSKQPRQVATVRIESVRWSNEYPDEDFEKEGFKYLDGLGITINGVRPTALWRAWRRQKPYFFVVRFQLVEVVP